MSEREDTRIRKRIERFSENAWIRTCQECGHVQEDVNPEGLTFSDSGSTSGSRFQDRKCKKCKSPALDWGTINGFEEFVDESNSWDLVCCRCQKRSTDPKSMLEVDALESDIRETEFTRCDSVGDRIIVCSGCATVDELKEGNFCE